EERDPAYYRRQNVLMWYGINIAAVAAAKAQSVRPDHVVRMGDTVPYIIAKSIGQQLPQARHADSFGCVSKVTECLVSVRTNDRGGLFPDADQVLERP